MRSILTVIVLSWAVTASAQEAIEPDQPDVTNGTHIVDVGVWQFEMGGIYSRDATSRKAFGSPLTVRVGLTPWLEARIGTDGVLSLADGHSTVTGLGNTQLGVKLRLWAMPGGVPVLSILPTINVPTASTEKGLGSGEPDLTLTALTGTDIGRRAHVDVNYGVGSIGGGPGERRFAQQLTSVSFSVNAGQRWNPYAEGFWFSHQSAEGGSFTAADAGAIFRVSDKLALDGGAQVGLSVAAPTFAAFGGVSVVVGDGGHGVHQRHRPPHQASPRSAGAHH